MTALVEAASAKLDAAEMESIAAMLEGKGIVGSPAVHTLRSGGNNRVFRVETGGRTLLLKRYFRDASDPRDRLATEFGFCDFAWRHGLRAVPEPIGRSVELGLGLYEFIPGRSLRAGEVNVEHVEQALNFCRRLNRVRNEPDAATMPNGSEACFSIAEHLRCVERRVKALGDLQVVTDLDREAAELVKKELEPAWNRIRLQAERGASLAGVDMSALLAQDERVLSPSDFGFHNVVREGGGRLRFVDLEYAGWDDPAKLVCDFFCQPAVPVSGQFFELFAETLAADLGTDSLLARVDLLRPVYQAKWCCIVLNVFLPAGRARRGFANGEGQAVEEAAKRTQVQLARQMLAVIEGCGCG